MSAHDYTISVIVSRRQGERVYSVAGTVDVEQLNAETIGEALAKMAGTQAAELEGILEDLVRPRE